MCSKKASLNLFILAYQIVYSFLLHQPPSKSNSRDTALVLVREWWVIIAAPSIYLSLFPYQVQLQSQPSHARCNPHYWPGSQDSRWKLQLLLCREASAGSSSTRQPQLLPGMMGYLCRFWGFRRLSRASILWNLQLHDPILCLGSKNF